MGKRAFFVMVVIVLSFGSLAAYGLGDKGENAGALKSKAPEESSAPTAQPKDKEMTKEEILAEFKEDLADNDEIFDAISELKISAGRNGNTVYTYNNKILDELSKEDLIKLYSRVRQALVKIRTERIERQLETVRRVEELQRTHNPPQPPRIPVAPPSAPRTPSPPPSPPQPQRR